MEGGYVATETRKDILTVEHPSGTDAQTERGCSLTYAPTGLLLSITSFSNLSCVSSPADPEHVSVSILSSWQLKGRF